MFRNRAGISTQRNGTVVIKVKAVNAKNAANQEAVDRLVELRIKAEKNPNSNFVFTIKRAIKSLAECKTPVTTYSEAVALKYVGPRIAKMIVPDSAQPDKKTPPPAPAAKKKQAPVAAGGAAKKSLKQQQLVDTASTTTTNATKRRTTKKEEGPSAKEKAYLTTKRNAENLILPRGLPWKVVLLIDGRETKSKHVVSKCRQSGIPCEERHLPIGDMAWIARCENTNGTTIEVMCGTIIERKEVSDLASSLFGTRYMEQRLRLQNSGLPQVLFLVEGNLNHCANCPADTLRMAMVETRVQLGFQVLHTQHLQDTVRVLKGLHRRVVQRTFPEAFASELPTFSSPQEATRNRKRRRPTSLLEMVFDTPPVPALGAKRFITYEELKAKVLWDREAGTRSVQAIYLAMLKQVATLSHKKCEAIAREYPTLNSLMMAYAASTDKRRLVQNIACDRQKVGPKSATELYVACCTQRDGTVLGHAYLTNNKSESTNSYLPVAAATTAQPGSPCSLDDTTLMAPIDTKPKAKVLLPVGNQAESPCSLDDSTLMAPIDGVTRRKPRELPPVGKLPLANKRSCTSTRHKVANPSPAMSQCFDLTADTPEKPKPPPAAAVKHTSPSSLSFPAFSASPDQCLPFEASPDSPFQDSTLATKAHASFSPSSASRGDESSSPHSADGPRSTQKRPQPSRASVAFSQSSSWSTSDTVSQTGPTPSKATAHAKLSQTSSSSSGDTWFQSPDTQTPTQLLQSNILPRKVKTPASNSSSSTRSSETQSRPASSAVSFSRSSFLSSGKATQNGHKPSQPLECVKFSQSSSSSGDFQSPETLSEQTPVQAVPSTAPSSRKFKTPASNSSSSYGCFTSPDPTPFNKPPSRMVSLEESDQSVGSAMLSTSKQRPVAAAKKSYSSIHDGSSPMISVACTNQFKDRSTVKPKATTTNPTCSSVASCQSWNRKAPPGSGKENSSIDLSQEDDTDDDDEGDLLDDLKTRLTKRYKPEVIEID